MRSKSSKGLKTMQVGDIHTGHARTPTTHILANLRASFNHETLADVDLLCINGDLFDKILYFPNPAVTEIQLWADYLLRVCADCNVVLRVLEGTDSHDAKQNTMFTTLLETSQLKIDFKYQNTVCIEYIEALDINVLFIPDNWPAGIDGTWLEVQGLLREHGLEKVDFACMHGAFTHQLPEVVAIHGEGGMHNPDRYSEIVEKYIFINHVHKSSRYKNIIAPGSFDRLAHGEEEDKGFVMAEIGYDGNDKITFVVNHRAMIYKTVDCSGLMASEVFEKIQALVDLGMLPNSSYVRLQGNRHDPAIIGLKEIRREFPLLIFDDPKVNKEKVVESTLFTDARNRFEEITVTPDNLKQLLMPRIEARLGEGAQLTGVCSSLIDELL